MSFWKKFKEDFKQGWKDADKADYVSTDVSDEDQANDSVEHFAHIDSDGGTHAVQQDDSVPVKINTK